MRNELGSQVSEVQYGILENLNHLIIILNKDFEMTFLNKNALKSLLNYQVDEVLNRSIFQIIEPKDHKPLLKKFNIILKGGE